MKVNRRNFSGGRQPQNASRARRNRAWGAEDEKLAPPEFVPTLALGHKFRFSGTSTTPLGITRAMLLNLMSVATTTTNQFRTFYAVKLKKVEVWVNPPALAGTPTSCSVEWIGNNAPSTRHSDTNMGVRPAYVRTSPPPDSSNRWWSISGSSESEVLFNISASGPAIVDVTVSIRLIDAESAVAAEAGTAAGAIVGTVYYNYLDGFASKLFVPVGVCPLP